MSDFDRLKFDFKKLVEYFFVLSNKITEIQKLVEELEEEKTETGTKADNYIHKEKFRKKLGISNSTFCKWEREGKIKVTRLGKGIAYVHNSELERLLEDTG